MLQFYLTEAPLIDQLLPSPNILRQVTKTNTQNITDLEHLSDNDLNAIGLKEFQDEAKLMDNDVMKIIFKDNSCTQLLLNTILDRNDLIVKNVNTEEDISNYNFRGVKLDIFATDTTGSAYNIEIQKDSRGAAPERARYHLSSIDTHSLKKGEPFTNLPTTYVIFITLHDQWHKGLPLYNVDRKITQLDNQPFGDRAHIIYVNGEYKGNDNLGKLMQDFQCATPNNMHNELLANHMRELKGGGKPMGAALDLIRARAEARGKIIGEVKGRSAGIAEGKIEANLETATNLKRMKIMDDEAIAKATSLPLEQVKAIAV